jgi:undecaprenyl diphosphate synthase
MDGNGRWARERGKIRTEGHLEGLKTARRLVEAASDLGIAYLTLYVFSTENWKRAASEVDFIMGLVKQHLMRELDFYRQKRIRIRHAGNIGGLPPEIAAEVRQAIADTAGFEGMQVILALNYGGRDEIARAVNRMLEEGASPVTEARIRQNLDNPDVPDPDLIIRTAGEYRTSNFLLWEGAYAEYYISEKFWPDWTADDLKAALDAYQGRTRRFGGVSA